MKILTLIPSLFGGGAEKITADLSFKIAKDYKHKILIYNDKGNKYDYSGDLTELNIKKKANFIGRIYRQILILKQITQYKKAINPKVTISHMLMANMLNILSKKKDKTICILHGEWSIKSGKSKIIDHFIKKQYAKSNMIISVSHHIKKKFENYYNLKVPHKVIYIGVDSELIEKKSKKKLDINLPNNYLIYVAGFRPVKNHIKLITQLEAYLKKNNLHLVLVGDGELRNEIEKTIKKLNLINNITLLGNLKNPYPIIKNAKISLLTSSSESFSLTVLESMVLGIPVISTDCGGPREIIDPEWNHWTSTPYQTKYGLLINTPDKWTKNTLIQQIDLLINNNVLYNSISKNSKERAKYFNITNTYTNLNIIIQNLIH